MSDYKREERLKYGILLTVLVLTFIVASAFALQNKHNSIRVRQMAHRAIHVAVLTTN